MIMFREAHCDQGTESPDGMNLLVVGMSASNPTTKVELVINFQAQTSPVSV